jgi:YHS domain-containing protein
LEFADQYQQENLVTDPVGEERFSRIYAEAQLDYMGKTYYFVTKENKERFAAEPERYVGTGDFYS